MGQVENILAQGQSGGQVGQNGQKYASKLFWHPRLEGTPRVYGQCCSKTIGNYSYLRELLSERLRSLAQGSRDLSGALACLRQDGVFWLARCGRRVRSILQSGHPESICRRLQLARSSSISLGKACEKLLLWSRSMFVRINSTGDQSGLPTSSFEPRITATPYKLRSLQSSARQRHGQPKLKCHRSLSNRRSKFGSKVFCFSACLLVNLGPPAAPSKVLAIGRKSRICPSK